MRQYLMLLALILISACNVPDDVPHALIIEDQVEEADSSAGDKFSIDPEKSTFKFEGYAPGKSHGGTFSALSGFIFKENSIIIGVEGIVQADSVSTGIDGLDKHLKSDDFFDVENYPTIEFTSSKIGDGIITGMLDFHGVEKEVSFPVTISENIISADFLLDTTPFGMTNPVVDKQVRIMFDFST